MSIDQPTLQDFGGAEHRSRRRREIILAEGGVYGRGSTVEHEPATPERSCLHCGRDIPADVARVIGDEDGNVPCCDECRVGNGNEPYSRISKAVRCFRAGSGRWANGGEH